jgi:RimJ/RimL family protein N-acetyltransferase
MELLSTDRLLLRHWDADLDNTASQRVAARLGMTDEGLTERWFGLTLRQYRKVINPQESCPQDER